MSKTDKKEEKDQPLQNIAKMASSKEFFKLLYEKMDKLATITSAQQAELSTLKQELKDLKEQRRENRESHKDNKSDWKWAVGIMLAVALGVLNLLYNIWPKGG